MMVRLRMFFSLEMFLIYLNFCLVRCVYRVFLSVMDLCSVVMVLVCGGNFKYEVFVVIFCRFMSCICVLVFSVIRFWDCVIGYIGVLFGVDRKILLFVVE